MDVKIFTEDDSGDPFTVKFYDTAGALTTPTAVTYRVDCVTNDSNLVTDTAVSAAATVTISSTTDWTQIVDTNNAFELRRLSVTATGSGWGKTKYVLFRVKNAKRIT